MYQERPMPKKAPSIIVEGEKYRVIENLGYVHSAGVYAKVVKIEGGERVAVKGKCGGWRWWTVEDRLQPMGRCEGQ